jgi:hypothetical protein
VTSILGESVEPLGRDTRPPHDGATVAMMISAGSVLFPVPLVPLGSVSFGLETVAVLVIVVQAVTLVLIFTGIVMSGKFAPDAMAAVTVHVTV